MEEFSLSERRLHGDVVVVAIAGELDMDTAVQLDRVQIL